MGTAVTVGRARVSALVLGFLVLQLVVAPRFAVAGVQANLMLLLAVAAGMVGGTERGPVVGFAAGLAHDLFLQSPFGLTALVLALVAFGVGSIQGAILRATWWIPVTTAFAASLMGVVLAALAGAMLGQTQVLGGRLVTVALVVAFVNAALGMPAVRAASWALRNAVPDRSYARA